MSENSEKTITQETSTQRETAKRIRAAGWGLFFVWVGASLLMDLSWGIGLIGIAAIVLLGQAARRAFGLRLEFFWVVVGVLFLLGGIWEHLSIDVEMVPILLILGGGALMLSLFRRGSRSGWHGWCRCSPSRGAGGWRCCSWPVQD